MILLFHNAKILFMAALALLFSLPAAAQEFSVSLNNMEPPKTRIFYSQEFPAAGDTLYLEVSVPSGWHINSNNVQDDFLVPSSVEPVAKGVEFHPALWPEPFKLYNETLKMDLLLLQDSFSIALPVKSVSKNANPYDVKLKFTYQACSKICLAPKTITVSFEESIFQAEKKNFKFKIDKHSLLAYILLAFLGGLLLNIMPCVLPVLFIKIFDLMRRSGEDRRSMLKWGLATAGGIFFSFAAIALAVLALRINSNAVGWGFQFQHPAYIAAMALCISIFALNLFGVFEIWLPGNAFKGLEKQSRREGLYGAFFYGILLVLLSTPCSAPFLGTAAGFAFTASVAELFAIFFALAAGLSLPYLLLSAFPAWTKKLPRPGNWMAVFKQFLGFPLLLTVVWLMWVFYRQTGIDSSLSLALLICAAAFFAWLSGILAAPGKPWRRFALLWLLFALIYVLSWNLWIKPQMSNAGAAQNIDSEWLEFSQKKLDSLQNLGFPVWVNATADWCITCKVNEKSVFGNEDVKNAFAALSVVKMRADYTTQSDEILKFIEAYGRSGVPFDLFLSSQKEPVLMPELLYPDTVLRALGE